MGFVLDHYEILLADESFNICLNLLSQSEERREDFWGCGWVVDDFGTDLVGVVGCLGFCYFGWGFGFEVGQLAGFGVVDLGVYFFWFY